MDCRAMACTSRNRSTQKYMQAQAGGPAVACCPGGAPEFGRQIKRQHRGHEDGHSGKEFLPAEVIGRQVGFQRFGALPQAGPPVAVAVACSGGFTRMVTNA